MEQLIVAKEFSVTPGVRYPDEGPFSGQEFRRNFLMPKLKKAIEKGVKLLIDLDGSAGYGSSFLEESFGGLIREEGLAFEVIDKTLDYKSDEDPSIIEEIKQYIKEAHEHKQTH